MKIAATVLCIIVSSITSIYAGGKLFDEKKLLTYLPKSEVKDFIRMEFTISDPAADMTSVMVQYMKMPSETNPAVVSVSIAIIDFANYRGKIGSVIKLESPGDEQYIVKGKYKGRINTKNISISGDKTYNISFNVGDRFSLTVFVSGNGDKAFAEKFIDLIDLGGLESELSHSENF